MIPKTKDSYGTVYRDTKTNNIHSPHGPALVIKTTVQLKETSEYLFDRTYAYKGVRHNIVGLAEICHSRESTYHINGDCIG